MKVGDKVKSKHGTGVIVVIHEDIKMFVVDMDKDKSRMVYRENEIVVLP